MLNDPAIQFGPTDNDFAPYFRPRGPAHFVADISNIQSNVRDSYILNYLAKLIQSTSPTSPRSLTSEGLLALQLVEKAIKEQLFT